MEKAKIDLYQFFTLVVLHIVGTSLVVGLWTKAEQDAWLTILLGMTICLPLIPLYIYFHHRYPTLPLTGYARIILGKPLGTLLGYLYIIYFLYGAARNLRDLADLLILSTMENLPLLITMVLMMLVLIYVLYLGIEVVARLGEIYFVVIMLFGAFAVMLIFASGIVDTDRLQPMLENGWTAVLKLALPYHIIPFAEIIVFTMILPYVNRPQSVIKMGLWAVIFSGILHSLMAVLTIAVLGADLAVRSTFPLLTMVNIINVADVFQNMEIISVFILINGVFFRIALYFYSALIGLADLANMPKNRLVFPVGVAILLLGWIVADSFTEHMEAGWVVIPYIHLPFTILIPLLLWVVSLIRNRKKPLTIGTSESGKGSG
ncbi:GerAB/ArcD/ProY family transporter [Desmospora activa]|uniref:Spore germination protein KB n=1 Tax=Desmospora activa DSM 45169 TaxID=1121389 RepID=A0A2T4Z6Q6_9BACL|nr:endospore germination permease [Desmospora activa]PTM57572.1 spore germination protein KB [Desmospora activa DSM 45169]